MISEYARNIAVAERAGQGRVGAVGTFRRGYHHGHVQPCPAGDARCCGEEVGGVATRDAAMIRSEKCGSLKAIDRASTVLPRLDALCRGGGRGIRTPGWLTPAAVFKLARDHPRLCWTSLVWGLHAVHVLVGSLVNTAHSASSFFVSQQFRSSFTAACRCRTADSRDQVEASWCLGRHFC